MGGASQIGILGVGSYLPPIIRKNDWWPEGVVSGWLERETIKRVDAREQEEFFNSLSDGERRVLAATVEASDDPFRGAVERRIMPDDMKASDMETEAARTAMKNAGVDVGEIDFILCQSTLPDFLHVSNVSVVHRNLGLPNSCFALSTEGVCNAFLQQLCLAERWLQGGRGKYGLVIQSANLTKFAKADSQGSAWFGDGASAAVIGPVSASRGILGSANWADGKLFGVLVTGVPGGRWYQEGGRIQVYVPDGAGLRRQFLEIADHAHNVLGQALTQAGHSASEVDFFACHQPTPWLGRVIREHVGMKSARLLDTFKATASLNGCNIPLILESAQREGFLRDGDLVAMFSGAAGVMVSGVVLRWGQG